MRNQSKAILSKRLVFVQPDT